MPSTLQASLRSLRLRKSGRFLLTLGAACGALLAAFPLETLGNDWNTFAEDIDFAPMLETEGSPTYIAEQPGRGLLIRSGFSRVDNTDVGSLARLLPSGALDPAFTPNLSGNGQLAVRDDGRILVIDENRLIRLLPDGQIDPDFSTPDLGVFGPNAQSPLALSPIDGSIVVAGTSYYPGGADDIMKLFRVSETGVLDPDFNVFILTTNDHNPSVGGVHAIHVLPDGRIVIGGDFHTVDGVSRTSLAMLSATGEILEDFDADLARPSNLGPKVTVRSIAAAPDDKLVIGGEFGAAGGVASPGVARLDLAGQLDPTFVSPFVDGGSGRQSFSINGVAVRPDGRVIVAGQLLWPGSFFPTFQTVQLSSTGEPDPNLNLIHAQPPVLQQDGKLLVRSGRRIINGIVAPGLFRLHENGAADESFSANIALKTEPTGISPQSDGSLLVWGTFMNRVNGTRVGPFARLTPDGDLVQDYPAAGPLKVTSPQSLSLADGHNLLIGSIQTEDSPAGAVLLDPEGRFVPGFSIGGSISSARSALHPLPDGRVLISDITDLNNYAVPHLARIDPRRRLQEGPAPTGLEVLQARFGTEAEQVDVTEVVRSHRTGDSLSIVASVSELELSDPPPGTGRQLIVQYRNSAGTFTVRVQEWRTLTLPWPAVEDGLIDTTFDPPLRNVSVLRAVAVGPAGRIVVAARVESASGAVERVMMLSPNGELLDTLEPGSAFSSFYASEAAFLQGGGVLLGGYFQRTGGTSSESLLRLTPDLQIDENYQSPPLNSLSALTRMQDGRLLIGSDNQVLLLSATGQKLSQFEYTDGPIARAEGIVHFRNHVYVFGRPSTLNVDPRQGILRLSLGSPEGAPPSFTAEPAPLQLRHDDTLELTAAIRSSLVSVRWWKDGRPLPGQDGPVLRLENAAVTDSGEYRVEAINLYGRTFSSTVGVRITETFNQWATRSGHSEPTDDPNGTGIPGLLRYALDLPPHGAQMPLWLSHEGAEFDISGRTEDLLFRIESSTDLRVWDSYDLEEYPFARIEEDVIGNRRVKLSRPHGEDHHFVRLQVELLPQP